MTSGAVMNPLDQPATKAHGYAPVNPEMVRFDVPPTADARAFAFWRESYKRVAPDPGYWPRMWDKVASLEWQGLSREELASITAPVLIVLGDRDCVRLEHAVEILKLIRRIPVASAGMDDHPSETR